MSSPVRRAFGLFAALVGRLNGLFTLIACGLVVLIVAIVMIAIVAREMGIGLLWANDVAQIAFIYLAFLSFGPALASGHHVTVELFEPLVPKPLRRHLDAVAAIACIVFGVIFLYELWNLAGRAFADDRMANMAIAIQLKWIQLAGLIGVAQFCLTAVLQLGVALTRPADQPRPASAGH
jgi:TRAP-type C4-dicarboxylate transport system permease small subunit